MLRVGSVNSSSNTRQTVLNNGTFATKLKRLSSNQAKVTKESSIITSKIVNDENEVSSVKEVPPLNSRSKKISKAKDFTITRRVFGEITNQMASNDEDANKAKKVMKPKEFIEDNLPKTANYFNLNYINKHTQQTYNFTCFQDKDLKIPGNYAEKTITHSCDNDCTTDEDQIRSAIRNLFRSIEGQVKEMKEAANKA
mmetsp:Transcript_18319/g.21113  ORF Transcript_18319/g.21113 Transcript_18319/m.21113 type:complete len:197 (+) Transcript_18319:71-661(+)|eukprot:CAMPEP_0176436286 /NCGR_PEP_ID=MMETSP0127-20121128/17872_1 /TAXON_ID=938130 /ORGANISM="Platyophrya macrostoma, Strain WH" /LENGTH=196 /DNA_ID=CAMNT_0017819565 /DNA_START=68 /DNA_END=658 /DNA_ORIENTATION=+